MIGELIRRVEPVVERKQGGLVNGLHKTCNCGRPCGGHMPTDPAGRRPGA